MFNVSRAPRGLIELLRMRNDGRMPPFFEESIRATVESRDFYSSDLYIPANAAAAVGALPGLAASLTFTVPLGLRTIGGSLTIGAAAATNVNLFFFMRIPVANVFIPLGQGPFMPNLAAGSSVIHGCGPFPFVMPAGTVISVQATGAAAGADHSLSINGLLENFTAVG